MKKKIKDIQRHKSGFEIKRISVFINGIEHIFMGDRIFTDIGLEIK